MNKFIEYIIKTFSETKLFEMAYDRKEFKKLIENLAYQIYENWCLIRYCSITNTKEELKIHWKSELRAYLRKICRAEFKLNRTTAIKEVLMNLLELNNNYNNHLIDDIAYKFETEQIDLIKETDIIEEIINDWQSYGLDDIIMILSDKKNIYKINDYTDSI
ncbi:hypothetical protein J6O48_06745 [bacterium]|nr:hypothetical protein [bacterium]